MAVSEATERRALQLRLGLFYVSIFTITGVYMPFWPVWLAAHGLTPTELGAVLAMNIVVRLFASPLTAHFADRLGERRRIIIIASGISLISFLFFYVAPGFWSLLLITMVNSTCWAPIVPLGDSLTMYVAYRQRLDYGRIRLWGSVAFIVCALGSGAVINKAEPELIFWLVYAAMAFQFLACFALPDARPPPTPPRQGSPAWPLITSPLFVVFMLSAGLSQASHALLNGFATLHWQSLGLGDFAIGLLWSEGVTAEVLLFAVGAALLRRIGPTRMLLLGAGAATVRWLGNGFDPGLPALIVLQALHGLSFGAMHLGMMHFITQSVAPRMSASAQSLTAATATGGLTGAAMFACGPLYAALGGGAFFVMAAMAAIGTLGLVVLALTWRGRRIE